MPPPSFGRYEPLVRLGRGGMAEVWAARLRGEAGFHRLVAIKQILPSLASDEALVERFLDEARIAAHVTSPRVVTTVDLGRSPDGTPYIVLDLVLGVTLAHFMRARSERVTTPLGGPASERPVAPGAELPLPALVELLAQVAEGLADVHGARAPDGTPLEIVHRDVSPQNVLVGVDGRARLGDFGIARAASSRVRTVTGQVMGKYGYMSPEQAKGRPVDARSDVFSLGVVAWEAIARKRLFTGSRDEETYANLLGAEVERLDRLRRDVPEALADVIASALARDPDARCPSARAFARALRRAAGELGTGPDARALAALVAEAGGPALEALRRRIAEASGEPTDLAVSAPRVDAYDLTVPRPVEEQTTRLLSVDEDTTDREDPPGPFAEPSSTSIIVPEPKTSRAALVVVAAALLTVAALLALSL